MSLLDRIKSDQLQARVARATNRAAFLTVMLGEAERVSKQATDEQMVKILSKLVKDNLDTISNVSDDLVKAKLQDEIDIAKDYLPTLMTEAYLHRIFETYYTGEKNKGQMMAFLKKNYVGQYDGKVAATVVDSLLK